MARRRRDRWVPEAAYSIPPEARGGIPVELEQPDPCRVWIQTRTALRDVDAVVLWYTDDAALVEWGFGQGAESAWVWREAVRPRLGTPAEADRPVRSESCSHSSSGSSA